MLDGLYGSVIVVVVIVIFIIFYVGSYVFSVLGFKLCFIYRFTRKVGHRTESGGRVRPAHGEHQWDSH